MGHLILHFTGLNWSLKFKNPHSQKNQIIQNIKSVMQFMNCISGSGSSNVSCHWPIWTTNFQNVMTSLIRYTSTCILHTPNTNLAIHTKRSLILSVPKYPLDSSTLSNTKRPSTVKYPYSRYPLDRQLPILLSSNTFNGN